MKNIYLITFATIAILSVHISATDYPIVSYEPDETTLVVSSAEIQSISQVQGGMAGAPFATDGDYVVKLLWTGQSDRKVELYHGGLNYNLDNFERILVDVLIPAGEALFQANGVIGFWSDNWLPNHWAGGNLVPTQHDKWYTIEMDVSVFDAGLLDHISAMVFEHYGADDAIIYLDNIRLVNNIPDQVIATGYDSRIDLRWRPVKTDDLEGYNIYRRDYVGGAFNKLNSSLHNYSVYSDFLGANNLTRSYYVTAVCGGVESAPSSIVSASTYAMTDDELIVSVQEATFRYFWDFAHPVSGLTRERSYILSRNEVTTGGSGFGMMAICAGVEQGFVTRSEAAKHILKMLTFLQEGVVRYHGAWSHWFDGETGEYIPAADDGAGNPIDTVDILETSFLVQGMLIARQFFDADNPVETAIRTRATQLYEEVDWDFFRRPSETDGKRLWWLWSPDNQWESSFSFGGGETMVAYILAIASPTHPIPASCYYEGFASVSNYVVNEKHYGYFQWVQPFEVPMFWTHYSFLGLDPGVFNDKYCNYFANSRNIALIDRAYCIDNPNGFTGHSDLLWGLTASLNPWGYSAHAPGGADNGTITPSAAIGSIPYTPAESIATIKHLYHTYGDFVWGPLGFYDAIHLGENWSACGYLAIDQGPIAVMIENYRTQLCWDMFMANPEITPAMESIGLAVGDDIGLNYQYYEGTWTALPDFDSLTPVKQGTIHNFDIRINNRDDYFAFRFTGYIEISVDGTYTFYTNSDDGSRLYLNDYLIVENDGIHAMQEQSGGVYLTAGRYELRVEYFEYQGEHGLEVSYAGPGFSYCPIPVNVLYRCNFPGDFNDDCQVDMADLEILANGWLSSYYLCDFAEMAENWME